MQTIKKAGVYPNCHWLSDGVHTGPVASPSQRQTRQTTTHTLTLTPRDNLESPINLTCMFLDGGRKPEYPERTHAYPTGNRCIYRYCLPTVVCQPQWLLAITCLSVWIWKDPGSWLCHSFEVSIWLWDFQSKLPESYTLLLCAALSQSSLHSLPLGSCMMWQNPASIALVLRARSSAAIISASVLSFRPAFSSHSVGLHECHWING